MEILYIYLTEYKNLKKQSFSFSSEFLFETTIEPDGHVVIEINSNPNFIPNFFNNPRIANVSAIIGQNGTGKSNILEFIKTGLPESMGGFKEECIIMSKKRIFQTDTFEYSVFYTSHIKHRLIDQTSLFQNRPLAPRIKEGYITTNYSLPDNHNTTFLYYSNIVDLKIPTTLTRTKITSEEEPV